MLSKKQIPNILSTLRLLLVPVFAWLFFSDVPDNRVWSLVVFIAAGITDVVDGYLARRNNWITDVGKFLDPLADKLMQFTAFVCLSVKNSFLIFLAVMIFIKELMFLIGGSIILKKAKFVVSSLWYGKFATAVLTVSVCCLILWYSNMTVVYIASAASAAVLLFAFVMYVRHYYLEYMKTNSTKG